MTTTLRQLESLSELSRYTKQILTQSLQLLVDDESHNSINGAAVLNVIDSLSIPVAPDRDVVGVTEETQPVITEYIENYRLNIEFHKQRRDALLKYERAIENDQQRIDEYIDTAGLSLPEQTLKKFDKMSIEAVNRESLRVIVEFFDDNPQFAFKLGSIGEGAIQKSQDAVESAIKLCGGLRNDLNKAEERFTSIAKFVRRILQDDVNHTKVCETTVRRSTAMFLVLQNTLDSNKELRSRYLELRSKHIQLEKDNKLLETETADHQEVQSQLESLQENHTDTLIHLSDVRAENTALHRSISRYGDQETSRLLENQQMRSIARKTSRESKNWQRKVRQVSKMAASRKRRLVQAHETNASSRETISTLEAALADRDNQIVALREMIEKQRTISSELNRKNHESVQQHLQSTDRIVLLEARASDLETRNMTLVNDLNSSNQHLLDYDEKVTALEDNIQVRDDKIQEYRTELYAQETSLRAQDCEIVARNVQLQQTKDELYNRENTVRACERELQSRNTELGARDTQIQDYQLKLQDRDTDLEAQQRDVKARDAQIQESNNELKKRTTELEACGLVLQDRDTTIQDYKTQLQIRDTELQARELVIQGRDTELRDCKNQLRTRNTELQARELVLQNSDATIQDYKTKLQIRDTELEARGLVLQDRDATIQDYKNELQIRDTELEARDLVIQGCNAELQDYKNQLHTRNTELQARGIVLQSHNAKLKDYREELKLLQRDVARVTDEGENLERNLSTTKVSLEKLETKHGSLQQSYDISVTQHESLSRAVERLNNKNESLSYDLNTARNEQTLLSKICDTIENDMCISENITHVSGQSLQDRLIITSNSIKLMMKEKQNLLDQIVTIQQDVDDEKRIRQEVERDMSTIQESLERVQDQARSATDLASCLRQDLICKDEDLLEAEDRLSNREAIHDADQEKIRTSYKQINDLQSSLKHTHIRVKIYKSLISHLLLKSLTNVKADFNALESNWIKAFNGPRDESIQWRQQPYTGLAVIHGLVRSSCDPRSAVELSIGLFAKGPTNSSLVSVAFIHALAIQVSSLDSNTVKIVISLMLQYLGHRLDLVRSTQRTYDFRSSMTILRCLELISSYIESASVFTDLVSAFRHVLCMTSPLVEAVLTMIDQRLTGQDITISTALLNLHAARDLFVQAGELTLIMDGTNLLIVKENQLAFVRETYFKIEFVWGAATRYFELVFENAPLVGSWRSPKWGLDGPVPGPTMFEINTRMEIVVQRALAGNLPISCDEGDLDLLEVG